IINNPGPPAGSATTPSPWSGDYTDKSGNNAYLVGEFYEAGVNLSLLNLSGECFSTIVVETRSSVSTDATLKDFVLAPFAPCGATMAPTPSTGAGGTVNPGAPVTDTATVTGGGITNPPTPTGTVTFFLCGPIASGTCSSGGTNVGTGTLSGSGAIATATSPQVNTSGSPLVPGRYCFRAGGPGGTSYSGVVHFGTGESAGFNVAR